MNFRVSDYHHSIEQDDLVSIVSFVSIDDLRLTSLTHSTAKMYWDLKGLIRRVYSFVVNNVVRVLLGH